MVRTSIVPASTRLGNDFFERPAEEVAVDLVGRILVYERGRNETLFTLIREVSAWEGETDSTYRGALYAAGNLAVSTKYGKRILDVATNDLCVPSCVTLIAGTIGDRNGKKGDYNGPGVLAAALEVDPSLDGLPIDASPYWIGGHGVDRDRVKKRNRSNLPKNCQGYFYLK